MKSPLCDDKSLLIGYLYGECDTAERRLVEEHLAGCEHCASEMNDLRAVRVTLRDWAPPDQALGFRIVRDESAAASPGSGRVIRPRVSRWLPARVPAWAQAAAAVLVLALGAGVANLDVRFGNGGVTVRTGWQHAVEAPPQAARAQVSGVTPADLAALREQLRLEIASAVAASATEGPVSAATPTNVSSATVRPSREDSAGMLRRVQMMVDDMERRKQRDFDQQLAERFLRFTRDLSSQRAADMSAIQQGLSQMNIRTNELNRVQNFMLRVANVQDVK